MRANGFLIYHIYSEGCLNKDGTPIKDNISLSERIPCSIQETNNKFETYEDGKHLNLSYSILVERGKIPQGVKRITLERNGTILGDFEIQGLPTPTSLDRIIIKV